MMTPSFALIYRSGILALASDDILLRMMMDTTCTAPLFIISCLHFGFLLGRSVCLIDCALLAWTSKRNHCGFQESCQKFCTGWMRTDAQHNNLIAAPFFQPLILFNELITLCLVQPGAPCPYISHKIIGFLYFVEVMLLQLLKVPA